ncbi:MAG: DUF4301 family protein [Bacteroidales bacterium]|jgi:hypothetical protein|nr:DUF4301 family protein [Bacteroidales bacterium]
MLFSNEDLEQIKNHKLSVEQVDGQINNFINGFDSIVLYKAATIGDGIKQYNEDDIARLESFYLEKKDDYKIVKFVPSSGAATRMFKDLYSFLSNYVDEKTTPLSSFSYVKTTIDNIKQFAFYNKLEEKAKQNNTSIDSLILAKDYKTIIEYILTEKGLNYGKAPKAWILFHKYNDKYLTPFEEHLEEGGIYCNSNNKVEIVFSISKNHSKGFNNLKNEFLPYYEKKYKTKYDVYFSFQSSSTDTIAVDKGNNPIHDTDNNLLFRPSGHGALIDNLNKIDADIIFIKNIDNVTSKNKDITYKYKKVLFACLIESKQKINSLINRLEKKDMSKQELMSVLSMIKNQIGINNIKNFTEFKTLKQYQKYLFAFLNRPIRVCGMVKNNGDVGGGPYWIKKDGEISLQIVEGAQVNKNNQKQKDIFLSATHFNPVDLVISTKDYKGKKFNLLKYVDNSQGFISEKTFEGQTIKVQERPGLWNGGMKNWLSIFVEVPLQTFNPVKTVNDLLKEEHQ